jgi:hypothetical protein
MKKVFQIVLTATLSICIFVLFVHLKETYWDDIYITNFVENISSPQQVLWRSKDEVIFATDEKFSKYSFRTNRTEDIRMKDGNEIVGITENKELIYCKYDIFMRYTEEDYAMKISIFDNEHNSVKEINLYDSFQPLFIDEKYIEGVTAMPFLLPYRYKVDIESMEVVEKEWNGELDEQNRRPEGLNLPYNIDVKKAYCLTKEKCIIVNSVGNTFAYEKKSSIVKNYFLKFSQKLHVFFSQHFPK